MAYLRRHLGGAFLLLLILPALVVYQGGLSGDFRLDDWVNLERLADEGVTLGQYVFGGPVGNLGRPLSYLSFYLQREDYPGNPSAFLWANLSLHLVNTLLVFWLAIGLARARGLDAPWRLAASVAVLWSILPIHVSTVLYVVQRMALLSATFVLLGCAGYVHARLRALNRGSATFSILSLTLWVGLAYLGILAKENAILAGLALACIEYFFFTERRSKPPTWWRMSVLFGPFVVVAFYLLAVKGVHLQYGGRDFTLSERLLTESKVLWDYLKIVLVPDFNDLGFFHDDFPISRGWGVKEIGAVIGWLGLIALIAWRRHSRWWPLAFAISWFLTQHLLESTVVPLELYFEHRNYLPSVGLLIGLVFGLAQLLATLEAVFYRRLVQGLVVVYVAWVSTLTWVEAASWGNERQFAADAVFKHPDSLRAWDALVSYVTNQHDFQAAYRLTEKWKARGGHRYMPGLDLRILMFSCYDPSVPFEWNDRLRQRFRTAPLDRSVTAILNDVLELVAKERCRHLDMAGFVDITDSFLVNPVYRSNQRVAATLRKLQAIGLLNLGKPTKALAVVRDGLHAGHVEFDYLLLAATLALEAGDHSELERLVEILESRKPSDFLLGQGQRRLLRRLEETVSDATLGRKKSVKLSAPGVGKVQPESGPSR